ncbi:MAG TPA: hypothetical protein VIY86_07155, partial [Pirellulaceae bacterium]
LFRGANLPGEILIDEVKSLTPHAGTPIYRLSVYRRGDEEPASVLRAYDLSPAVAHLQSTEPGSGPRDPQDSTAGIQPILSLVKDVLEDKTADEVVPELSFHAATRILLVRGSERQVARVEQLMRALPNRASLESDWERSRLKMELEVARDHSQAARAEREQLMATITKLEMQSQMMEAQGRKLGREAESLRQERDQLARQLDAMRLRARERNREDSSPPR